MTSAQGPRGTKRNRHDSLSLPLSPVAETRAEVERDDRVCAVRVGWFPGIYYDVQDALWQCYRYPHGEVKPFDSDEEARTWYKKAAGSAAATDRHNVNKHG